MSTLVRFWCPGVPAPGGSKKAYVNKYTGRVNIVDDARNNAGWKQRVSTFASQAMAGKPPFSGPLRLTMSFFMPRPRSHYGTGKNAKKLKPTAPYFHTSKPDATKLVRSTEDACKGITYVDDSLITEQSVCKVYDVGQGPGVMIEVQQLGDA